MGAETGSIGPSEQERDRRAREAIEEQKKQVRRAYELVQKQTKEKSVGRQRRRDQIDLTKKLKALKEAQKKTNAKVKKMEK